MGLSAILGDVPNADQLRKPVGYVNKAVVGTGLSSVQNTSDVLRIPVDMIEANPFQPRLTFDQEALEELSESIKTLGLIQPITVRKVSDDKYQIISGERRYRACRLAGMTMVPAYIKDANDKGMLEMAIVENIQRENLDPIEVAMSYQRLMLECNLTQEEMSERVSKKRSSVANYLRLLKLPAKVQHDVKVGQISMGHAKVILGIEDPLAQEQLCDLVIKNELSVRQLEDKVRQLLKATDSAKASKSKSNELTPDCQRISDQFARFFANAVDIKRSASGRGTMTVKFDSDDELAAFLNALEKINQ